MKQIYSFILLLSHHYKFSPLGICKAGVNLCFPTPQSNIMFMARDPENKFPLESSLMDKGKVQSEGLRGPGYHLLPSQHHPFSPREPKAASEMRQRLSREARECLREKGRLGATSVVHLITLINPPNNPLTDKEAQAHRS